MPNTPSSVTSAEKRPRGRPRRYPASLSKQDIQFIKNRRRELRRLGLSVEVMAFELAKRFGLSEADTLALLVPAAAPRMSIICRDPE